AEEEVVEEVVELVESRTIENELS
ncbi:hypothetical protein Tco_1120531, partial [Tanacetum coccineum]